MSETPSLIEAVARAIADRDGHAFGGPDDGYYMPLARAALRAIEASGYAVVPIDARPTASFVPGQVEGSNSETGQKNNVIQLLG